MTTFVIFSGYTECSLFLHSYFKLCYETTFTQLISISDMYYSALQSIVLIANGVAYYHVHCGMKQGKS